MSATSDWAELKARITRAFLSLKADGINARGPIGFDQREALEKLWNPTKFRGYAFFHSQDVRSARSGNEPLWVGFGVMKDDATPAESAAVGREVAETLGRSGLFVEWDGKPKTRLQVYLSVELAKKVKERAVAELEKREVELRRLKTERLDAVDFFGVLRTALAGLARQGEYQISFQPLDYQAMTCKAKTAKKTVIVCPSEFLPTWDKITLDIATFPEPHDKTVVKRIAVQLRKAGFRVSYIHGSYLHLRTTK
jgi:hypothetical protein